MLIDVIGAAILGVLISRVILFTAQRMLSSFEFSWLPGTYQQLSLALGYALMFAIAALQNNKPGALLCTITLITLLLILALIDLQIKILPNLMTLPLLATGLLLSLTGASITLGDSILGMALGYLILLVPHFIFKLMTSRDGIGFGDIKLMAAIGAWIGWQYLIEIILIASISAALIGYLLVSLKKHHKKDYLAFGPYLVGASLIILLVKHPFQ